MLLEVDFTRTTSKTKSSKNYGFEIYCSIFMEEYITQHFEDFLH